MRTVETIPEMGGIKENDGGSEFKYIWYIVRSFMNATMYLQHNNKNKKWNNAFPYNTRILFVIQNNFLKYYQNFV
jgi:hypothetical protein